MPGLVGLAPTPRNRGLLSFRALNSLKKVFGAYHPAWLIAFSPFSNSVSLETVVTLTGKFCGSSGSFCAVTVIGGNVVYSGGCAAAREGKRNRSEERRVGK